jgi:hypothetical protein
VQDGLASVGYESLIEVNVVDRAEDGGENLVGRKEMVDIRASKAALAGITLA